MKIHNALTLTLRIIPLLFLSAFLTSLSRHASGQAVVRHEKRCPIHRLEFQPDKVKVIYGMPEFFSMDLDDVKIFVHAQKKGFAYSNFFVPGGCVVFSNSPEYAEVFYCPQCRISETAWMQRWMDERESGVTITEHMSSTLEKVRSTINQIQRLLEQDQKRAG